MVTPFFHALFILSVLGGVVLTAVSVRPGDHAPRLWFSGAALGLSFAAAVVWVRPDRPPEPAVVSGFAALTTALQLFRPKYSLVAAAYGGALAGLSASLLQVYGVAVAFAIVLAAIPPAAAGVLGFRVRDFAPRDLREQALLGLLLFSMIWALAPGVAAGWHSALNLNIAGRNATAYSIPAWTLSLGAMSMALGGAWAVWRRR
jgi:hypothetical protein